MFCGILIANIDIDIKHYQWGKVMTKPYFSSLEEEFAAVDLYRLIASDRHLHKEVLSMCRNFVPGIDTLMKALLTLGSATLTDIVLDVIEKMREESTRLLLSEKLLSLG